jgi:PKD repeat protein
MRAVVAGLILIAFALAGCSGDGDGPTPTTSGGVTGTATSTRSPGGTTTELTFSASPTSGDATLTVQFGAMLTDRDVGGAGSPHDGAFTWVLMFGDGTDTQGDEAVFPLDVSHAYGTAGEFTATIAVTLESDETLQQSARITVNEAGEPQEPPQLVFEFGPSAGCAGDVLQIAGADCVTALLGPGATGPDGFWLPLDERYWGLSLIAIADFPNALGDTDGFLVREDGTKMNANINNGAGPAQGVVPDGAAWLFVYNYALPSQSLVVTFS